MLEGIQGFTHYEKLRTVSMPSVGLSWHCNDWELAKVLQIAVLQVAKFSGQGRVCPVLLQHIVAGCVRRFCCYCLESFGCCQKGCCSAGLHGGMQIGRASCRERVCQYV